MIDFHAWSGQLTSFMQKGAVPVTTISAHTKKIYGIDWSRQNDHDIVTCSLDQLVKVCGFILRLVYIFGTKLSIFLVLEYP